MTLAQLKTKVRVALEKMFAGAELPAHLNEPILMPGPILVSPSPSITTTHRPKRKKAKSRPNTKSKKSLRLQCRLSVRDIAQFLKMPLISGYGTMTTSPARIPIKTQVKLFQHITGVCKCEERGLNCRRQESRLFTKTMNEQERIVTPLFTPGDVQNYLDYANGESGLGDLKKYFEEIEDRVIRCALALKLLKPIHSLDRRIVEDGSGNSQVTQHDNYYDTDENLEIAGINSEDQRRNQDEQLDENLQPVIASHRSLDAELDSSGSGEYAETQDDELVEGADFSWHVVTEGASVRGSKWFHKPLKRFDRPIPHDGKRDKSRIWIEQQIERLRKQSKPGSSTTELERAEKALNDLFGGQK